jgi:hypothetical protein
MIRCHVPVKGLDPSWIAMYDESMYRSIPVPSEMAGAYELKQYMTCNEVTTRNNPDNGKAGPRPHIGTIDLGIKPDVPRLELLAAESRGVSRTVPS